MVNETENGQMDEMDLATLAAYSTKRGINKGVSNNCYTTVLAAQKEAEKSYREAVGAIDIFLRIANRERRASDIEAVGNAEEYGELEPLSEKEVGITGRENPRNIIGAISFYRTNGVEEARAAACHAIVKVREAAQKKQDARNALSRLIKKCRSAERTVGLLAERYNGPKMQRPTGTQHPSQRKVPAKRVGSY